MAVNRKKRLDILLVDKGLVPTRSKARDLIKRGDVMVDGETITKPGQMWAHNATLSFRSHDKPPISKGILKLKAAVEHFELDVLGRHCLDIGGQDGSFSEFLLARGAGHISALDQDTAAIPDTIANNPKRAQLSIKQLNDLTPSHFSKPLDAIAMDGPLDELTNRLAKLLPFTVPGAWVVSVIKTGETNVDSGANPDIKINNTQIKTIHTWFNSQEGWHVLGVIASPVLEDDGAQDYLLIAGREDN